MADVLAKATLTHTLGIERSDTRRRLPVRVIENRIEDGYGVIRTAESPSAEMIVVHDGSEQGIKAAAVLARGHELTPVMQTLLVEALDAWASAFDSHDDDACIPASDVVEWFAWWRRRVRSEFSAEFTPTSSLVPSRKHAQTRQRLP